MLTIRQLIGTPGPVIERGECHYVYLPSGELRECDGLADGERILDEWELNERNTNGGQVRLRWTN